FAARRDAKNRRKREEKRVRAATARRADFCRLRSGSVGYRRHETEHGAGREEWCLNPGRVVPTTHRSRYPTATTGGAGSCLCRCRSLLNGIRRCRTTSCGSWPTRLPPGGTPRLNRPSPGGIFLPKNSPRNSTAVLQAPSAQARRTDTLL